MKRNNRIKTLAAFLAVVMLAFLVTACGEAENGTKKQTSAPETLPAPVTTEPEEQVLAIDTVTVSYIGENTYQTGSEISLNRYGQIENLIKYYGDVSFQYDGEHHIIRVDDNHQRDGYAGFEIFQYENGHLVSGKFNANDGGQYIQDYNVVHTFDDEDHITSSVQKVLMTDPKDGSTKREELTHNFTYDSEGRISTIDYYISGRFSYKTHVTYDEAGNILSYICDDQDSLGEFITIKFTYKSVNKSEVEGAVDSITNVLNLTYALSFFIF